MQFNNSINHSIIYTQVTLTDDVPVDVRVDLKNVINIDLDDGFFVIDAEISFT
jgi:hypothetical protein